MNESTQKLQRHYPTATSCSPTACPSFAGSLFAIKYAWPTDVKNNSNSSEYIWPNQAVFLWNITFSWPRGISWFNISFWWAYLCYHTSNSTLHPGNSILSLSKPELICFGWLVLEPPHPEIVREFYPTHLYCWKLRILSRRCATHQLEQDWCWLGQEWLWPLWWTNRWRWWGLDTVALKRTVSHQV